MEVVVIRPCLVVGPGSPGNIEKLIQLMAHKIPVPVPNRKNRRSYCSLESLNELIRICLEHPAAAGNAFIAADANPVSTEVIMQSICKGLGVKFRAIRLPPNLLKLVFFCFCKLNLYDKLYGDYVVDASYAVKKLGWKQYQCSSSAFEEAGKAFYKSVSKI